MKCDLLCQWLGLDGRAWPPDPHTLLGLPPETLDPALIERRVHERMVTLRGYQLSHPEEATEGMNRLAQAFVVLTEKAARNGAAKPGKDDTLVAKHTVLDWREAPPAVRAEPISSSPPPPVENPPEAPSDPILEWAQFSPEARRGLATLPQIVERIDRTRQLLWAWQQAGRYLGQPGRKLTRATEELNLTRRLHAIFEAIDGYPKFVGQPGRPGYRVVAMAQLEMTADMFKMLDPEQRQALAKDWKAGHDVLLAHRKFLRQQFKTCRRQPRHHRVIQATRTLLNDHPVGVSIVAVILIAVCAAIWFW